MTTLLDRLRQETRLQHEQTEQLFYTEALQNGTLTVEQYRHLLRTHLNYHQALETAIDRYPGFFRAYEPETRRKTGWLQADLAQLHEPQPAFSSALFSDWSPMALLGAAYVGEGSMLGGTVIWRLLQNNVEIQPLLADARFYLGYGPSTGSQWKRFGAFALQQGDQQPDAVVEAAKKAFEQYQTVFRQTETPVSGSLYPA
ncbi:hypothetical protein GCM10028773_60080 [Spirosoma koreense]